MAHNIYKESYPKDLYIDRYRTIKEKVTFISIDSRDRQKVPKNIYDDTIYTLQKNSLEFKCGTGKVKIFLKDHNFEQNNRISITGIDGRNIKLKHKLFLFKNSQYAKIIDENNNMTFNYHHKKIMLNMSNVKGNMLKSLKLNGIPINLFNRNHEILFDTLSGDEYDPINNDADLVNLKADIKNINNIISGPSNEISNLNTILENKLINKINSLNTHDKIDPLNIINKLVPTFYLIKLPKKATKKYCPNRDQGSDLENTCIKIKFLHLCGIGLSKLNADFPLSINNEIGNHIISKIIDEHHFFIRVKDIALSSNNGGSDCIELAKIIDTQNGYPRPNHYKIFLEKTLHNVKRVELISSIFPNTRKIFENNSIKKNNSLYWNILDDGDTEYSIDITPGNYTPSSLESEITKKIFLVKRTTHQETFDKINTIDFNLCEIMVGNNSHFMKTISDIPNNELRKTPAFPNFEFINIDQNTIIEPIIDIDTNIVSFSAFSRIFVKKSIGGFNSNNKQFIDHDINSVFSTFVVVHPCHPYNSDDENNISITISGSTNITENSVTYSASTINTSHTIVKIIDNHRYRVTHNITHTLSIVRPPNFGGFGGDNITITFPIKFRILFNKNDTIGHELGFSSVGKKDSITNYDYTVKNIDFYDGDIKFDSIGMKINKKDITLSLSGDQYFFMTNDILSNIHNLGPVDDVFAKIQLQDIPNTVLYNTFVRAPKIFEDPIKELSELEFTFFSPEGQLFNFGGIDHSYCLRIVELVVLPIDTHISERTGIEQETFSNQSIVVGLN